MKNMKSKKNSKNPNNLILGTIEHYKYYVSEYERIKELADNAIGNLANDLYLELDGIEMVLEEYKSF
tara:strand:- start:374 stop:574 length:201 start_codon:yes stop_codon:yes gene_type:complete